MYTSQALWTQAREGLDVTTIICANRSLRDPARGAARVGVERAGAAARARCSTSAARRSTSSRSPAAWASRPPRATTAERARRRARRGARRARPAPRRDGDLMAADELELSEHAARTREQWNNDAPDWVASGRAAWERRSPNWGMWNVPEDDVHILPDVRGLDVIDLGCGTGYWCAWFARLGASPVGLDVSEAQLETARTLQREYRLDFPLVHASAEAPPFPDGSFDLAFPSTAPPSGATRTSGSRRLPAVAARRAADLPVQLGPRDAHRAAERRAGRRDAAAPAVRHAPDRLARHRRDNFHLPTPPCTACSATPASRSRRCTSCARRGRRRRGEVLRPPGLGAAVAMRGGLGRAAPARREAAAPRSSWRGHDDGTVCEHAFV